MNKKTGILNNIKKEPENLPIDSDDEIDFDIDIDLENDIKDDIKNEPIKLKTKKCKDCAETKQMSDFYSTGVSCKNCMCKKSKAVKRERKEGFRVCPNCNVNKSTTDFYLDAHDTRGIQSNCNECHKISNNKVIEKYKEANKNKTADDLPQGIIKCSDKDCTGNKIAKDFVRDNTKKNGLQSRCKECVARHKTGKVLGNANIDPNITKKSCKICNIELFLTEFNKSDSGTYGYANDCRTCRNAKRRLDARR